MIFKWGDNMGIQIGGMSSGLDTTSIVKELMAAESLKLQSIEQEKKLVELKKEAYTKINDSYADFVTDMRKLFEVDGTLSTNGYLRPSSTNNLSWMYQATSSSSAVSVSSTATANPGRYELEVEQLADNFKAASLKSVSVNKNGTSVAESLGIADDTMIDISITNRNGETVSIKQTAGSLSLDDLASELNKLDGVTVQYDSTIDRFFLSTDKTGADNGVTIVDNTLGGDGLLKALHLTSNNQELTSGTYKGQNAVVTFNGAAGIEFESNNFNIQGINFSLKSNSIGQKIEVNVDTNVDAIVDKVVKFVDSYNKLIEDISGKLSETFYRDYPPLTDDQRKELTENEIKLWEEKSNSGLVRNDDVIERVQSSLRDAITAPIKLADGRTVSMADLGITTKNYFNGGKNGALTVDVDKLKASLQKDPSIFNDVFFGMPADSSLSKPNKDLTADQRKLKNEQNGIFNRITDVISDGIGNIVKRGGLTNDGSKYRAISSSILVEFTTSGSKSYLDSLLQDKINRLSQMNKKLAQIESRYWKQFTAMEQALSQLQSQQSSFLSQLGM